MVFWQCQRLEDRCYSLLLVGRFLALDFDLCDGSLGLCLFLAGSWCLAMRSAVGV